MATLTEPFYSAEFIATEANGKFSRDNVTLASGNNLGPGRICGKITASGKWTDYVAAITGSASDGSQVAAGILYRKTDASSADATTVMMVRACEVNRSELDFGTLNGTQQTAAIAQLAAAGIIVRPAV